MIVCDNKEHGDTPVRTVREGDNTWICPDCKNLFYMQPDGSFTTYEAHPVKLPTMRRFEIVNPSDECYIYSDDPIIAAAAVCVVGEGAYGMNEKGGERFEMPIFLFGGSEEWFKEKTGAGFDVYLKNNHLKISDCLKTFEYPKERTSLNNIGARASAWAKILTKQPPV